MSADFNAGSIEGTLDLDTRPFARGLEWAKAKAADFGKSKATAKADLDTSNVTRKDAEASRKVDEFGRKKATAKADLDISGAIAKAEILNKALGRALDAGGLGKKSLGPGMFLGKLVALAGGFLSLAAAAAPATAAVAGFGAAAGVAFAGAGLSLALFAKVATADFARIQNAAKKGLQLSGPAGAAEVALKRLQKSWHGLLAATAGPVYKAMDSAFNGLAGILPRLAPLIDTVAHGLDGLVNRLVRLAHTQAFGGFLKQLQGFMRGFLAGAGPVLTNTLKTFFNVFSALRPLMSQLGHGIMSVSAAVEHFSAGPGLRNFVSYVERSLPKLLGILHDTATGIGHLVKGIAPLTGPALNAIQALVRAVGSLNLAPFAKGFGDVLNAARPLLPVLATLLNTVLLPVGHALSDLASSVLKPLAHSLNSELKPAFSAFSGILNALEKPLMAFAGSIANLANPTGIAFVATALKVVEGVVKTVAPAFGRLAVALESVVDTGLKAITPLLPKLSPLLNVAAKAAAGFADSLAKILSHKDVALTILGIIGAYKTYQAVSKGISATAAAWDTVTGAISKLRDMSILTRIELGLLKVQEIAVATWGKIVQGATKLWAAAQWLLNAALDANPIGLVVVAIAALAAGLIYAYKHSETFRNIVHDAFHAIATAASWAWNSVIKPVFKFWLDTWLNLVSALLNGAAKAFGWIPGLGGKLKSAAKEFDNFKNRVNASLSGIKDKTVNIAVTAAGSASQVLARHRVTMPKAATGGEIHGPGTGTSDSIPAMLSNGEFVVRASQTKKHRRLLHAINDGVQGFANGGEVGGPGLHPAVVGVPKAEGYFTKVRDSVNAQLSGIAHAVRSAFLGTYTGPLAVGSGVHRWAPLVLRVLSMLGQPASLLGVVLARMTRESGGNPGAINLWDSNAAAGDPSRGLMQVIGSTFAAYGGPFRGLGIYNPLANIYAGLNYALHRYGSIYAAMTQPGGYANGTLSASAGWHWVGERGPELLRFRGGERVLSHRASLAATDTSSLLSEMRTMNRTLLALLTKSGSVDLSPESRRALLQAARAM